MSFPLNAVSIYPFESTKPEVLKNIALLKSALDGKNQKSTKHSLAQPVNIQIGENISYARWHHGENNTWLLLGKLDDLLHIADLTTGEREHLFLQARKHTGNQASVLASASAPHTISTLDQLCKQSTITVLGLVFSDYSSDSQ